MTDTAIDRIADAIVVMQEQENTVTPVLKQQLQQCETEIRNVIKAIRLGIITDTTKECLEDLETQRESLKGSIAQLQLERRTFSKEEIVEWIGKYKNGNINDPDYRKEIIDTFVNSVYVYDDKLILTYNYKDGSQTLTLQEINATMQFISKNRDGKNILSWLGDAAHLYRWQEYYNALTVQMARAFGCRLVDLRTAFLQSRNFLDLLCPDGIHPTDSGYALAHKTLSAAMY